MRLQRPRRLRRARAAPLRSAASGNPEPATSHALQSICQPVDLERLGSTLDVFDTVFAHRHGSDVQSGTRLQGDRQSGQRPMVGQRDSPPHRLRRRTAAACRRSCRSRGRARSATGRARRGRAQPTPAPSLRRRARPTASYCRPRRSEAALESGSRHGLSIVLPWCCHLSSPAARARSPDDAVQLIQS